MKCGSMFSFFLVLLHGTQQNVHLLHLLCFVRWKLIFSPPSASLSAIIVHKRSRGSACVCCRAATNGLSLTPGGREEVILVRWQEQTRAILCQNKSAGRTNRRARRTRGFRWSDEAVWFTRMTIDDDQCVNVTLYPVGGGRGEWDAITEL